MLLLRKFVAVSPSSGPAALLRFGFALQDELVAAAKAAAGSGLEKVSRNRIGIEVLGTGGHRILAL